ncbi:unnamed protein product [Arabidopsis halleri]
MSSCHIFLLFLSSPISPPSWNTIVPSLTEIYIISHGKCDLYLMLDLMEVGAMHPIETAKQEPTPSS